MMQAGADWQVWIPTTAHLDCVASTPRSSKSCSCSGQAHGWTLKSFKQAWVDGQPHLSKPPQGLGAAEEHRQTPESSEG